MLLKLVVICICLAVHVAGLTTYGKTSTNNNRQRTRYRSRLVNATTDVASDLENEDEPEDEEPPTSVLRMLHQINDKLTVMSAVNEQQIRRLETFEYRLTKLEVQIQEKTEGLRTDLKEVSRRVQQLDWLSSKTESSLDTLKSDTTFLKQAVEHSRLLPSQVTVSNGGNTDASVDVSNKVQMTLRGVQSILNSISNMQYEVSTLKRNFSRISNSSSLLDNTIPLLLSTKHFQRSLIELERRAYRPLCAGHSNSAVDTISLPRDCTEVTGTKSGVYRIQPPQATVPFFVYCDLETNGGGWTVLQKRTDGTLEFYKGWHDYKHGFGNIGGEFWLGLEKMHLLTNFRVNEIYIELENFALEKKYATYSAFAIGAEVEGYPISFLGAYDGTAGDSLLYHAGQKFSTYDVDHDNWAEGNCAQSHTGAWWYNGCDTSNLNGRYLNGELPDQYEYQGVYWYEWQGPKYSLKSSKIMIRPYNESNNGGNSPAEDVQPTAAVNEQEAYGFTF
ncbi:uncharacterized protein CBL_11246 [Carabus blaptoides fortunei]